MKVKRLEDIENPRLRAQAQEQLREQLERESGGLGDAGRAREPQPAPVLLSETPDKHGRVKMLVDGKVVNRVHPDSRKRDYHRGTPFERAMARVEVGEAGCWIWNGSKTTAGYGHMKVSKGTYRVSHLVIYEHLKGPVPDGPVPDHLCRNRACVNPDHLEPVTHLENVRRGDSAKRKCDHAESEVYRRKSTGTIVYCRACRREKRAANKRSDLSEKQFMQQAIDLARLRGWMFYHTHDSRRSEPGFPDLVLVRGERLIFAELKTDEGSLSSEQSEWLEALQSVAECAFDRVLVATWRPRDFEAIEEELR